MGRSVELCSEYIEVAYLELEHETIELNADGHADFCYSNYIDGENVAGECDCGMEDGALTRMCEDGICDCWQDFKEGIEERLVTMYPSMVFDTGNLVPNCNRETVQLCANSQGVYITISEYCGAVALCLCVDENSDYFNIAMANAKRMCKKFLNEFSTINSIGRFSNGEQIFERVVK